MLGDSSAYIYQSKFEENVGVKLGGAICAESFSILSIDSDSFFYNNEATDDTGDSIYASNSLDSIIIKSTKFVSTKASNFFDFADVQNVLIDSSTIMISDGVTNHRNKTTSVLFTDLRNLTVTKTTFKNLLSNSEAGGGSVTLVETDNNKSPTNSFTFSECIFDKSVGINGGALFIDNVGNVIINKGTIFQ